MNYYVTEIPQPSEWQKPRSRPPILGVVAVCFDTNQTLNMAPNKLDHPLFQTSVLKVGFSVEFRLYCYSVYKCIKTKCHCKGSAQN